MFITLSIIASSISIIVNIYTLWSVRKTLILGAKNTIDEVKIIVSKI
jgi:hypothetical protein